MHKTTQAFIPKDLAQKNACAIKLRNQSWETNKDIPAWVDIKDVGLDQFFTCPLIAAQCWRSLEDCMRREYVDRARYTFIEPSAGLGAFYDLLPPQQRIGIDIVPFRADYIQSDFLSWRPQTRGYQHICIGNPPFGQRAWLALLFLNHAAQFCDYVGFILPMGFQNRGSRNLIDKVRGLNLVHSSVLPTGSFIGADGKRSAIHSLWQIWSRRSYVPEASPKTCDQIIEVFTVNRTPGRCWGHKRLQQAHCFLQRTFYKEAPLLAASCDQMKYDSFLGIVIKRDKVKVLKILKETDWTQYSNLALNHARHIGMSHIRRALTDKGLFDR